MMKNKSRFWPQFWVLGSYIKVEGADHQVGFFRVLVSSFKLQAGTLAIHQRGQPMLYSSFISV